MSTASIRLRVLLVAIAIVVLSLVVVRQLAKQLPARPSRMAQAAAHLPDLVAVREPTVLVIGTSTVRSQFDPAVFDAASAEHGGAVRSFNLGFGGVSPTALMRFSRKVLHAYAEAGRRPALVLLEFQPATATEASRRMASKVVSAEQCLFAQPRDVWREITRSPEIGLGEAFNCWLYGCSPSPLRRVGGVVFQRPSWWPAPAPQSPYQETPEEALERRMYPLVVGRWWDIEKAGFRNLSGLAEYRPAVDYYRRPENLAKARDAAVDGTDCLELHFDEGYLSDFITMIEEARRAADQVRVVVPPYNRFLIARTPAAEARFRAVLARFRATGAVVDDYSEEPTITSEDFMDDVHLHQLGASEKYTRLIARRLQPLLNRTARE